jgi:hypothetical protein
MRRGCRPLNDSHERGEEPLSRKLEKSSLLSLLQDPRVFGARVAVVCPKLKAL